MVAILMINDNKITIRQKGWLSDQAYRTECTKRLKNMSSLDKR